MTIAQLTSPTIEQFPVLTLTLVTACLINLQSDCPTFRLCVIESIVVTAVYSVFYFTSRLSFPFIVRVNTRVLCVYCYRLLICVVVIILNTLYLVQLLCIVFHEKAKTFCTANSFLTFGKTYIIA